VRERIPGLTSRSSGLNYSDRTQVFDECARQWENAHDSDFGAATVHARLCFANGWRRLDSGLVIKTTVVVDRKFGHVGTKVAP